MELVLYFIITVVVWGTSWARNLDTVRTQNDPSPLVIPVFLHMADRGNAGTEDLLYLTIMDVYGKSSGEMPLYGHGVLERGKIYDYELVPTKDIGLPVSARIRIQGSDGALLDKIEVSVNPSEMVTCKFHDSRRRSQWVDEDGSIFCHFEQDTFKTWYARTKSGDDSTRDTVLINLVDIQGRFSGWMSLGDRFRANQINEFDIKLPRGFDEDLSRIFVWKVDADGEEGSIRSGTDKWLLQYITIRGKSRPLLFPFNVAVDGDENDAHYCYTIAYLGRTANAGTVADRCYIDDETVPSVEP